MADAARRGAGCRARHHFPAACRRLCEWRRVGWRSDPASPATCRLVFCSACAHHLRAGAVGDRRPGRWGGFAALVWPRPACQMSRCEVVIARRTGAGLADLACGSRAGADDVAEFLKPLTGGGARCFAASRSRRRRGIARRVRTRQTRERSNGGTCQVTLGQPGTHWAVSDRSLSGQREANEARPAQRTFAKAPSAPACRVQRRRIRRSPRASVRRRCMKRTSARPASIRSHAAFSPTATRAGCGPSASTRVWHRGRVERALQVPAGAGADGACRSRSTCRPSAASTRRTRWRARRSARSACRCRT